MTDSGAGNVRRVGVPSTYLKVVLMMTTRNDKFQEVLAHTRSKKTEFHLWERNGI